MMGSIALRPDAGRSNRTIEFSIRAAVLLVVALVVLRYAGWLDFVATIPAPRIEPLGGQAYNIDLHPPLGAIGKFLYRADTLDAPTQSTLQLFESGVLLNAPHSLHQDIGKFGEGRYSHWHTRLLFSSSDNTDPRVNSRTYQIIERPNLFALLIAPLVLVAILIAYRQRRSGQMLEVRLAKQLLFALHKALHKIVWMISTGFAAYAVVQWLTRPATAEFSADSLGYVFPGISALSGGPFLIASGRHFVYPLIVFQIVREFGSGLAIVQFQAVLYLLTALLTASVPVVALYGGKLSHSERLFGSLAAALLFLLSLSYAPQFYDVHVIMPECLYAFLASAVLALLIVALKSSRPSTIFATCFLGIFVTVANYYVKPHWGAAMIASGAFFAIKALCCAGSRAAARLLFVLGTAAVVFATLVWPSWYFEDYRTQSFGPKILVCIHAPLVVLSIDKRLATTDIMLRPMLEIVSKNLSEVIGKGSDGMPLLGYNGDPCFYSNVLDPVYKYFDYDRGRISSFFLKLFVVAVWDNKLLYLEKVMKQLRYAFNNPLLDISSDFAFDDRLLIKDKKSVASYFSNNVSQTFDEIFSPNARFNGDSKLAIDFLNLGLVLDLIGQSFWPIMFAGLLAATLDFCTARGRWRAVLRRWAPSALAAMLFTTSLIVVALANTFDVGRYLFTALPLVLGVTILTLMAFAEMVREWLQLYVANRVRTTAELGEVTRSRRAEMPG
jgi:hypothetical protein